MRKIAAHDSWHARWPIIALSALAGCGGDPASDTGAASAGSGLGGLEACALLTTTEIEAATGKAAQDGRDMSQAGGQLPICSWAPADGESYDTLVNLLVTVNAYDDFGEFSESSREALGDEFLDTVQEVGGVGDFGVWMDEARMLQVYDGDRMVQVTVEPASGRDPLEAARELGLAALGKIR